jgi:hypothetical protein
MNEFLLLFRNASGDGKFSVSPEEMQASIPKWQKWIGEIAGQGKLVSTEPLKFEGRTVRHHGVIDGPYVEVKELVVGYLICKADSLDEAVSFGKTCPIMELAGGSVEVRPLEKFNAR